MILKKLRLKGISTAFPGEIAVELPDSGGLTCFVGANGGGKTHLLELTGPGVIYRELPSYGVSIADHVLPEVRDAFAELTFDVNGSRLVAAVQVDRQTAGGRGKTEAYLTRDGEQVAGPGVREYDAAVCKFLPPREFFLASVFAAQGGGGSFFALPKSARKDLIMTMLGMDHLQEKSERARARAQVVLNKVEQLQALIEQDRETARRVEELQAQVDDLKSRAHSGARALVAAKKELTAAEGASKVAAEKVTAAQARAAAAVKERQTVEADLAAASATVSDLKGLAGMRQALADSVSEATEAAAQVDEHEVTAAKHRAEADKHREAVQGAEKELAGLTAQWDSACKEVARLKGEVVAAQEASERCGKMADLEASRVVLAREVKRLSDLAATLIKQRSALETAAKEELSRNAKIEKLDSRIQQLEGTATLMIEVPGVPECDACPLTAHARDARAQLLEAMREREVAGDVSHTVYEDQEAANVALTEATNCREEAAIHLSELDDQLRDMEGYKQAAAKLDTLQADYGRAVEQSNELQRRIGQLKIAVREAMAAFNRARSKEEGAGADAMEAKSLANLLPERSAKLAKAEEAGKRLGDAARRVAELEQRLEGLPAPEDTQPLVDAQRTAEAAQLEAQLIMDTATEAANSIAKEQARCEGEMAALGDPVASLSKHEAELKAVATAAADWTVLEKALGREGVQAFELDAAGPGITALANDLLLSCYGPRFTLALTTVAPRKAGGGVKEVFEPRILDAESGREVTQGSGGEMVLVGEALRLALALFQAGRSGFELKTLWRDETVGALSPDNADRYVKMLRRAMQVGDFHSTIMVAHQQEVWEQADTRIFIGGGKVRVDG